MNGHDPLAEFLNPVRKVQQEIRVGGHREIKVIKQITEETINTESGSIDTYITETDMKLDCGCYGKEGGVCDICHAVVCNKCFAHCDSCGKAICNRCTTWLDKRPLCEDCCWTQKLVALPRTFFAALFGRNRKRK